MTKTKLKDINLVIKSNIKKVLPKEIRVSADLATAINKNIEEQLKKAAERAKANKRTTILPQDI